MSSETIFLLGKQAFQLGYRRLEWRCHALNAKSVGAARDQFYKEISSPFLAKTKKVDLLQNYVYILALIKELAFFCLYAKNNREISL